MYHALGTRHSCCDVGNVQVDFQALLAAYAVCLMLSVFLALLCAKVHLTVKASRMPGCKWLRFPIASGSAHSMLCVAVCISMLH